MKKNRTLCPFNTKYGSFYNKGITPILLYFVLQLPLTASAFLLQPPHPSFFTSAFSLQLPAFFSPSFLQQLPLVASAFLLQPLQPFFLASPVTTVAL